MRECLSLTHAACRWHYLPPGASISRNVCSGHMYNFAKYQICFKKWTNIELSHWAKWKGPYVGKPAWLDKILKQLSCPQIIQMVTAREKLRIPSQDGCSPMVVLALLQPGKWIGVQLHKCYMNPNTLRKLNKQTLSFDHASDLGQWSLPCNAYLMIILTCKCQKLFTPWVYNGTDEKEEWEREIKVQAM